MLKILLIDDNKDDVTGLGNIISNVFPGSDIFISLSGLRGIQIAIDNNPDVILLNAYMSDIDAIELCQQLKIDKRVNSIPVILLIETQDKLWKLKALDAGAEGFISRPVDPADLIAQIKAMSKIKNSNPTIGDKSTLLNKSATVLESDPASGEKLRLSEHLFRIVADATYDWDFLIDQNRQFIYCSPSCERITGYKQEQFMTDSDLLNRIVHPDDQVIYRKHLLEVHSNYQPGEIKFRIIRADETLRWIGHVCRPIIDEEGVLMAIRGSNRDITEQMLFEDRLKNSEDKYRSIFENVQDVYYEASLDGVILEVSPSVEIITRGKFQRADFIGQTIMDLFINIKERDVLRNALFEKGSISDFEISVQFKDGQVIPCTVSSKIWLDEQGTAQKIIGSIRDITMRKQAEESLRRSEESYRSMFENNPQPMFIYDLESLRFVKVNNAALQFYGYSEDEFLGMTVFDIRPAEDFVRFAQHNSDNIPRYRVSGDWRHRKKNGEIITVDIISHALTFNNRPARHVLINDVTERNKAKEKLQKSEERLRAIFESNSAVKLLINPANGQIVDANIAAANYYGWSCQELKMMKIQQINTLSMESTMAEMQKINSPDQHRYEFKHRHKDGSITDVEVFSSKVKIEGADYLHSIIHDISDRKKVEKALRDQEGSYRTLFMSNPHPMWVYNLSTLRFMAVNNAAVNHYGYSVEEFYQMTISDIRPEEDIERLLENIRNVTSGLDNAGIWCHRKKNGQLIWVEIVSHTIDWFNEQAEIVLVNDVTEHISIEHDLRISEERFRKVVECSPNGIVIYQDGKFVYINPAGLELFGAYDPNALIGKEIRSVVHPQSVDSLATAMELVARGESVKPVEEKLIRMDGLTFHAEIAIFATTNNNLPAGQMIIRNITDRKLAEASIQKLNLAINQSQEIIFMTNKEGIITFINSQFTKVYGYTPEEIIGKQTPSILKSGLISHQQYVKLWDGLLKKKRKKAEYINKCKDGRLIDIEGSADPILDEQGEITGFLGIQRDISQRKKAERALAHSHELMRYVIEHNRSAIAIHDKYLRYIYVSQRYLEDYQIHEDIIGRHHYEVFPDLPQKWKDVHQKALAGEVSWANDDPYVHTDGTVDWTRWECRPWYSADGSVGGIIVYTELINDMKKAEADLVAAKERAEESDQLKSAFLANMSHEIRTPLNSIVGFSELLRDSYYEEQQKKEFVDLIIRNGQNLLAIINDILDISKIQAGELKIKKKELSVNSFLRETVKEYAIKFQNHAVEFQFVPADNRDDISVLCDPERLSQVFNNLLSNAGKFTKQGYVRVSYQVKDELAEFQVKDTGIGIDPEYHEKIFERFRQVEDAHSRKYGGNGLGLAISRKLVELMGGNIWLESQKGIGSTFYFTLPLAKYQLDE